MDTRDHNPGGTHWLMGPSVVLLATLVLTACDEFRTVGKKLVVVGIDGMDPNLLTQYMNEGRMPNFKKLAEQGGFHRLGTSNPPQSPVAWSNFITGLNPGGHGVYDFLHRDPESYHPVSSTQTTPPLEFWPLPGKYQMPSMFADEPEAIRQGKPFWEMLEDDGIRADVYRMPAAYPLDADATNQLVLTDMGTPDLMGGMDGTYFYYTSDTPKRPELIKAGRWISVTFEDDMVQTYLPAPPDPFLEPGVDEEGRELPPPETRVPFTAYVDPEQAVAYIEIEGGDSVIVEEGEWSDWAKVNVEWSFYQAIPGIVQFYLQQARPHFRLYASPVNIDPSAPSQVISSPDHDAVIDIANAIGLFYTQGLAEETKALQELVLNDEEFLEQCNVVTDERMAMLDYALDRFDDGLLFFYFSTVDLRCHMMWRHIEQGHPARREELARRYQHSIRDAYEKMDEALGVIREGVGEDTRIAVMSDHGFAPYTRKVHLNQWLLDEGYLVLDETGREMREQQPDKEVGTVVGIDWTRTKAYSVGFNGIYINVKGRESQGIVPESDRAALAKEIGDKLAKLKDPERGIPVIRRVYPRDEVYQGAEVGHAPDLVVGYDAHFGSSDDTALGNLPPAGTPLIEDNESYWSGNHLMDPAVVPGILVTNLEVTKENPSLVDLTATLLKFFDQKIPEELVGKPIF